MTDHHHPLPPAAFSPTSVDPYRDQGLTGEELLAAVQQWQNRTDSEAVNVRRLLSQVDPDENE